MLHGCSPRVRTFADFVASEIARSRAGVRRSHHPPLNVRAKELPSSHPAPPVKRRLRFNLASRTKISEPALRRAKPELRFRHKLVTLPRRTHTDTVNFRPVSDWAGIDRRSAFGAEGLLPLGPVLTRLDVDLRFAREKPEGIFASEGNRAKCGA